MSKYHKNLSPEIWNKQTLAEQMANIGSEYFRAKNWKMKEKDEYFWPAFERMLELLELSLEDKNKRHSQLKEIARLKESLNSYLTNDIGEPTKDFDNYFMQFSLLARNNR